MQQQFEAQNETDQEGRPAGGFVRGVGLSIEWQRGPLGRGQNRTEPNGAFVGTVIAAAKQRLAHFQTSRFACDENRDAIRHLDAALAALERRTQRREREGLEGTHHGR